MALLSRLAAFDTPPIAFRLDGRPATGHQGETLLAAILRQADHLRLHEATGQPRAGFCLMGACQDCWVDIDGQRRARACTTLLEPGMDVSTGAAQAAGDG